MKRKDGIYLRNKSTVTVWKQMLQFSEKNVWSAQHSSTKFIKNISQDNFYNKSQMKFRGLLSRLQASLLSLV